MNIRIARILARLAERIPGTLETDLNYFKERVRAVGHSHLVWFVDGEEAVSLRIDQDRRVTVRWPQGRDWKAAKTIFEVCDHADDIACWIDL